MYTITFRNGSRIITSDNSNKEKVRGINKIMPPYSKRKSNLDEQQAWKLWFEVGTLEQVALKLHERGMSNPNTGLPISRWGVEIACWRYASQNIAEAKEDFRNDYIKRGVEFGDYEEQNFYRRLMVGAKRVYTGKSLERWIRDNGLEQYRQFM